MFVILIRYLKSLSEIEKVVDSHRAFLDRYYQSGHLIASGPQVPRSGGVILAKASSREELVKIFSEDPFVNQGLAEYQYIEFVPVKKTAAFDSILTG
ncbi:MAG: YciI family protein [Bdellovibrionia bacterium]